MWLRACVIVPVFIQIAFVTNTPLLQQFTPEYTVNESDITITTQNQLYHIVYVTWKSGDFNRKSDNGSLIIKDLQPCTRYDFYFKIRYFNYSSSMKNESHSITTGFKLNQLPIQLIHITCESETIKIEVQFSKIDCVDSIEIQWNGHTQNYKNSDFNGMTITTIHELIQGTDINLEISLKALGKNYKLFRGKIRKLEPAIKSSTSLNLECMKNKCGMHRDWFICQPNKTIGNATVKTVFTGLHVSTKNVCHVSHQNRKYRNSSRHKRRVTNKTTSQIKKFVQLKRYSRTADSINITWECTTVDDDKFNKNVTINVTKIQPSYNLVSGCNITSYTEEHTIDWNKQYSEIQNLESNTNYSILMIIKMFNGSTERSKPIRVSTLGDVPPEVASFSVANISAFKNQSELVSATLVWTLPCQLNGQIEQFSGEINELSTNTTINWTLPVNLITTQNHPAIYNYKQNSLTFDSQYRATIKITLSNKHSSNGSTIEFSTPPECKFFPPKLSREWGLIKKDKPNLVNITITANMDTIHNPNYTFSIMISEHNYCSDLQSSDKLRDLEKNVNDTDLMNRPKCHKEYKISNITKPILLGSCNREIMECVEPPFRLKLGTTYQILLRVYTACGYTNTEPLYFTKEIKHVQVHENQSFSVPFMIFVVTTVANILLLVVLWIYKIYKCSLTSPNVNSGSTQLNPIVADSVVIEKEFAIIRKISMNWLSTCNAENCQSKNRYANVLPYDYNRVVLIPNKYCTMDYINASYINGNTPKQNFIATQGPLEGTVYDFWHMIFENKCHKIVMLNQLVENYWIKCFQYYPNKTGHIKVHDLVISNVNETNYGYFIRRELKLLKGRTMRLVVQYHFMVWPNQNCPNSEMDILNLIEFINTENNSTKPIVVHCSAGVGRTGTFIALHILMDKVKNNENIHFFDTIKRLRVQRMKMVHTKEHYALLYAAVHRYIQNR